MASTTGHGATVSSTEPNPALWVDQHGDVLFGYALLRVRDAQVAEELVQEAFLAALKARERFAGQASERTWLVGILRHKITDHFRNASRRGVATSPDGGQEPEKQLFNRRGLWRKKPAKWSADPGELSEQKEFWAVFYRCMEALPQTAADAFSLREVNLQESEQVCEVLGISATNLWTRLHRARTLLRHCLEEHWFGPGARETKR